MRQALSGLKVIEIATFIAGPYCGMMLGDNGADVIKIERPGGGDENRAEPPFVNGESAPFMLWNRNKRSVVLDLKLPRDRDILLSLVAEADILVENMRPGAMDRLGLGWDNLSARNPRLIYGSISGYGRSGPMGNKGGFDLVLQGFSGLMGLNGPEDGPPFRLPVPICDIMAGTYLTTGILLALQARVATGRGQLVETSLFEAALSIQLYEAASHFATGEAPQRLGQRHRGVAPYQVLATADGYIAIGVAHQAFWLRFCDVLGVPELATEPDFRTNASRVQSAKSLVLRIEQILRTKSSANWLAALDSAGIPCGPIQRLDEALRHPQTAARDMVAQVVHPVAGPTSTLGLPIKLSETPGHIRRPAPLLGEHNEEVLADAAVPIQSS